MVDKLVDCEPVTDEPSQSDIAMAVLARSSIADVPNGAQVIVMKSPGFDKPLSEEGQSELPDFDPRKWRAGNRVCRVHVYSPGQITLNGVSLPSRQDLDQPDLTLDEGDLSMDGVRYVYYFSPNWNGTFSQTEADVRTSLDIASGITAEEAKETLCFHS
ncbi:MAG: hypothetical protein WC897_05310 [Candidatus Gracilibacteria bacterium]